MMYPSDVDNSKVNIIDKITLLNFHLEFMFRSVSGFFKIRCVVSGLYSLIC